MRNNNNKLRHTSPLINLSCEDLYRPDIESRVDLIEKYHTRIKEGYLEHLDTPFLSSRESYIEISIEKLCIESIFWKQLLDHTSEHKSSRGLYSRIFQSECMRVYRAKVFEKTDTRDLWDILE